MKIVIPINPVTKKNHGVLVTVKGRKMMLPSNAYAKWEKKCKEYIPERDFPIDEPINLKCLYFMQTRRKCDITNLLQATCDMLVKYKILKDDNYSIVSSVDGTQVFYDKENPRTEIYIEKKNQD